MFLRGLSANEIRAVHQRYGALLARRCRLLLRDRALAEDAMQELLSTLLRRGEGLRSANVPYRWLCRAVDRTCIDLLRRGRRVRGAVALEDLAEMDPIGPAPGVDAEARYAVLESLERLPEEQQMLAILLFVDGLSQGEAADELGVSRATVNRRAREIRAHFRRSVSPSEDRYDAPE
ncbi:sigma-70 family RNA polymerase sigma factor [Pendulispora rubella]|uniref:Sigma-70 family RNA polymerase sigma factor n=1 Tax=Pendulispora rubella TaxID=2741070 RepID=A0ABZ2KPV8_9BACT